ncbi:amidohydrolase family protein [Aquiflexum lacus]|uniref:amidohydrolase family protein n=1 Tax=Aquiflexum lacus TaxID=2483805 RepID=UPI00189493C0|nr:amidohydrolase family protein [Aquiflexum lacus]
MNTFHKQITNKLYLPLLFIGIFCFSFSQVLAQEYVVTNVHIINLENDQILKDHLIHVKGDKIEAIMPMTKAKDLQKSIQRIDGKGSFAFAGLAEMHSHIPTTETDDFSYIQDVMWLYLANGILNVRGMIGHHSHLELKKKIDSGEITGPRIFAAGQSLNGGSVENPEMGAQMVREQKTAGFDHLKLHPGLDMPKFLAIANTAKEEDIMFGGHISLDVGLVNSLNNGYRSVEHMDGYIEALVTDKSKLDPQVAGPFSMMAVKDADISRIPYLVQLTLDKKAWIAPTLTLFERFFGYIPADEFRLESDMKYMPGIQVQQWVNQKKLLENQGVLKEENVKPYLEFRKEMLMALHRGGVPIIMSSDSPQVFNVPGFSIHNEISSMHEAGMTPNEILITGSLNIAKYFEKQGQFGVIKKGASADFVLVEGNPLENLSNLRKVNGVMVRGKWLPKEKLQGELMRIEEKNLRR